jgi:hypothetical protein
MVPPPNITEYLTPAQIKTMRSKTFEDLHSQRVTIQSEIDKLLKKRPISHDNLTKIFHLLAEDSEISLISLVKIFDGVDHGSAT